MTTDRVEEKGRGELLETISKLENQLQEGSNEALNFGVIGAVVFAAGLIFLLTFDTQAIPLKHGVLPAFSKYGFEADKYRTNLDKAALDKKRLVASALESALESTAGLLAERNLGAVAKASHGPEGHGVVIREVLADSTAQTQGLAIGQTVSKINGHTVHSLEDYHHILTDLVTGQALNMVVNGAEKSMTFKEKVAYGTVHHQIEHLVHSVEHITEEHWKKALQVEQRYLVRLMKLERAINAAKELGDEIDKGQKAQQEVAEHAKETLTKAYNAELSRIQHKRDLAVSKACLTLAKMTRSYPVVDARLFREWDPSKGKVVDSARTKASFIGQLVKAYDSYYELETLGRVRLEHKKTNVYPTEQRFYNDMYGEYINYVSPRLDSIFGSPEDPQLTGYKVGKDYKDVLKRGAAFYFRHCQHCHGISGYGDGPTANFLVPRPRVYTKGIFKMRANMAASLKPTIPELVKTLKYGMPGSMMPPFKLYRDSDLNAVAHYVRYLAMRGEVESKMHVWAFEGGNLDPDSDDLVGDMRSTFDSKLAQVFKSWKEPEDEELWLDPDDEERAKPSVDVAAYSASLKTGHKLFLENCAKCHGFDGRGGGKESEGMKDAWGFPINPRNLTRGIYRGGGRPRDIFFRVRTGINGSGMPGFKEDQLSDEQVWALVNHVKSLAAKVPGQK